MASVAESQDRRSVDGYLLDRGFQVLLTGYPEARKQLDYAKLDLQYFDPGSIIRVGDRFAKISDPWRQPSRLLGDGLLRRWERLADKLRIGRLRKSSKSGTVDDQFLRPDKSTEQELSAILDSLPTSSISSCDPSSVESSWNAISRPPVRMMYFVFRMFSVDGTAIPSAGMGAMASPTRRLLFRITRGGPVEHSSRLAIDGGSSSRGRWRFDWLSTSDCRN